MSNIIIKKRENEFDREQSRAWKWLDEDIGRTGEEKEKAK